MQNGKNPLSIRLDERETFDLMEVKPTGNAAVG